MDSSIEIPSDITYHFIEGKWLIIALELPSWIVVNEIGIEYIKGLRKGWTINNLISNIQNKFNISRESAIRNLKSTLIEIDKNMFYQNPLQYNNEKNHHQLFLYLTNQCNLNCVHCYLNAGEKLKNELSTDDFKESIHNVNVNYKNINEIVFTGGEPLLRYDIFVLSHYAKNMGFYNILFTNGTLINKKNIKNIKTNFNLVQISLDGTNSDINDKIRGENTFNSIIKSIKLVNFNDIPIRISITVSPLNYFDLKQNLVRFLTELNLERVDVILGPSMREGRAISNNAYLPDNVETRKKITELYEPLWKEGWGKKRIFFKHDKKEHCDYGNNIIIYPNGDYLPCPMSPPIGNIKNRPINDLIQQIKKDVEKVSVNNIPLCAKCDLKYICAGGCLMRNLNINGKIDQPACNSKWKKQMYRDLVKLGHISVG